MTSRPRSTLRDLVWFALACYAVQLGCIAGARLWPAIDVQDGEWRYVVVRGTPGMGPDLIPIIGLMPQVTGEPVTLIRTNVRTGRVCVTTGDLISDFVSEFPALSGVAYGRRLFDASH